MTSSSATLSISPTALKIGQQVDIESRTWPGINKPGGHATITKLHYAHNNNNNNVDDGETTNNNNNNNNCTAPIKIDVKYVLGGTEKQIELLYVKPHVELVRGGRSRRVDQKMTVDSFGSAGEKENNGAVGGRKKTASSSGNKRKSGAVENETTTKKKKKVVVQKKKKENDTAAVKIEVDKPKIVETEDTKKNKKSAPPKKEGKKKATSTTAAAAEAGNSKTKGIASYFTTASSAAAATSLSAKAKAKTVGPSRPSKVVKETTKKVKKTTNPTTKPKPTSTESNTANNNNSTKSSKQVKYSPNSILAVRAAHTKSPAKSHIFGTKTIGLREGFQFSTTTTASVGGVKGGKKKKKRGSVQESLFLEQEGEKTPSVASTAAAAATVSSSLAASKKKVTPSEKKSGMTSSSSSSNNSSNSKEKSVQNHKTIQSLYKNECVKAQDFVKSMVGSATKKEGKEEEKMMAKEDVTSSPESCLELEMDSGRMDLFNSLLTEVMFKKGLDSMEVDELICRINTSPQRGDTSKPFTLLEVKAFLERLDSQNRIFVSWEEEDNNSGTIYSI